MLFKNISKKFVALILGLTLLMTSLFWILTIAPQVLTEKVTVVIIGGIIGLCLLYGFSNVVNNFIKSKYFSKERFESEQK